jgi:hypothetical protein
MGGRRADVDHRAASGADHGRHERLADQHGPDQVVGGQRLNVLERDAQHVVRVRLAARSADVAAGAVHQDLDLAERRLDVAFHLPHRGLVADVA